VYHYYDIKVTVTPYVSHKAVQIVLARSLKPFDLPPAALACVILATAIVAGSLLYYLVESPFMALRDRWVPSNFAGHGTRVYNGLSRRAGTDGG
jgi:peptidoglycan/LPS O-acetylase OafA/YrhL